MGVFGHAPFRRSADRRSPEEPEPPVTGNQQRIYSDPVVFCEKPSRKQLRIQSLAGWPPKIPCAAEQGINSTTTGSRFATNRELIRHNRESGAKSRRTRFTTNAFSVEDKKLSTMASPK